MFMDIAEVVAKRSACLRNNVGAVIVNDQNNIVSIGYNGLAAGIPHCTKEDCKAGCNIAIHAEQNALMRMPRDDKEYRLFCTVSPCIVCAKAIHYWGGIKEVYYRYPYRTLEGIIYLLSNGIKVYRILTGGIINEEKL